MFIAALLVGLASLPAAAIPAGEGFLMPTGRLGLARYQLAIGAEAEFARLKAAAEARAELREPNTIKVLNVIVREIDADLQDADGKPFEAKARMTEEQVVRAHKIFEHYKELVFVYTGGALRVEGTQLVRETPVTEMNSMGNNRWWLNAPTALEGSGFAIPEGAYDHVSIYYPRPEGLQMGLLGGAVGKDYGAAGASYWTQWLAGIDTPFELFHGDSVVSVHEWLHNVSFTANRLMGYTPIPDCHAGEEYGWRSKEGGYGQWMAWNRDLMLRVTPIGFWYAFDTSGDPKAERDPINDGVSFGEVFRWVDVREDFIARLPWLSDEQLASLCADESVRLRVVQPQANGGFAIIGTPGEPPSLDDLLPKSGMFDDVMIIAQRAEEPEVEAADGGYLDGLVEGMLRLPGTDGLDVVLVRSDLADAVLPLLRTEGTPATEAVRGLAIVREPGEDRPINLVVVTVKLAPAVDGTEVGALRLR